MKYCVAVCMCIVLLVHSTTSRPKLKNEAQEEGNDTKEEENVMDEFHGILMGNKQRDTREPVASSENVRDTMDPDKLRHGLLMHGDKDAGHDHDIESHNKPQENAGKHGKDSLDADNLRHKLVIHGDINADLDHDLSSHDKREDKQERKDSLDAGKHGKDLLDADNLRHKLVIHGDINADLDHDLSSHDKKEEKTDKKRIKDSTDMENMRHKLVIHGDMNAELDHDLESHDKKEESQVPRSNKIALDADNLKHKLMFHGGDLSQDLDHKLEDHQVKKDKDNDQDKDQKHQNIDEKLRHGLLMHGDFNADLSHEMNHDIDSAVNEGRRHPKDVRIQPNTDQIRQQYLSRTKNGESLVMKNTEEDEKTMERIRERLKNVDFSKVSQEDVNGFVDWLVDDEVKDARFVKTDGGERVVLPQSLQDNIDEVKRRYLRDYYDQLAGDDDLESDDVTDDEDAHHDDVDDIVDVMDVDESDEDYRDFVRKTKARTTTHNGL